MPFIEERRRLAIEAGGLEGLRALHDLQPGDLCYSYYKKMVKQWKASPRWSTAHEIYKDMRSTTPVCCAGDDKLLNQRIAYELAWQVFFQLYVIPYELEKMEQNGDIQ